MEVKMKMTKDEEEVKKRNSGGAERKQEFVGRR